MKYPSGWGVQEFGSVATDFTHPTTQLLFTVYPSEADVLNTLDDEADSYIDANAVTGSVSRTYPVINGIPAIQLSYGYFDTTWNCDAQDIYLALFDGQTRLFELDSQVCEDDVDAIQPVFDEMRESFNP